MVLKGKRKDMKKSLNCKCSCTHTHKENSVRNTSIDRSWKAFASVENWNSCNVSFRRRCRSLDSTRPSRCRQRCRWSWPRAECRECWARTSCQKDKYTAVECATSDIHCVQYKAVYNTVHLGQFSTEMLSLVWSGLVRSTVVVRVTDRRERAVEHALQTNVHRDSAGHLVDHLLSSTARPLPVCSNHSQSVRYSALLYVHSWDYKSPRLHWQWHWMYIIYATDWHCLMTCDCYSHRYWCTRTS